RERRHDVPRQACAGGCIAVTRLHDVGDHGLDLKRLTTLDLSRNVDERAGHQIPSTQAASVTTTSADADQKVPSLISAIAVSVWLSARRMRVAIFALPARGPRWTAMT